MRLTPAFLFCGGVVHATLHFAPGYAADAPRPPMSDIVELPKFVVTDSRELPAPESWRYAAAPGLEILSKADNRHVLRFAQNFHRLRQVTEIVWPAILQGAPPTPAALILCNGGNEFDTFAPTARSGAPSTRTSLLLNEQERTTIVVDVVREKPSDRTVFDVSAPINAEPTGEDALPSSGFMTENDPYREFYLQYFRLTIRRGAGHVPPWLEEGLVQLLASIDFSKDYIAVGRLRDGAGGQRADEFNVQLARRPLLGLDRMFAENPSVEASGAYPAQCYAFVHLCLYGRKARFRPALQKLIERAATEPVTEKLFKECFNLSFEQMAGELRAYTTFTAHEYVEYRLDRAGAGLADLPAPVVREATQAEIGRIKGEAYQLAGHAERARSTLLAPYIRGEPDDRLLATLGQLERSRGQDERARKFLEVATRHRVIQPRAYLELARIRFAEAKSRLSANGLLSREQAIAVLQPLLVASRQPPPLPEIYELTAEVWAISDRAPSTEELRLIYEGAHRFPRRLRLIYLAAALALRHGTTEHARALVEHGLQLAGNSETAVHFRTLQAQLPK